MTAIAPKETMKLETATGEPASNYGVLDLASKAGRFFLHFLEMLIAMQAGMGIFHLVMLLVRTYSGSRALDSGTALHAILMTVFMTIPMAAWMIFRGHGWRHSAEMVIAMIAPGALIGLLCQLGLDEYLPWLAGLSTPLMFLAMIGVMLYRREHYTPAKGHVTDHAQANHEAAHH